MREAVNVANTSERGCEMMWNILHNALIQRDAELDKELDRIEPLGGDEWHQVQAFRQQVEMIMKQMDKNRNEWIGHCKRASDMHGT